MSIIFNSSAVTSGNQWQWVTTSGLTSVSTPRMTTNGLLVFLDAANPKSYVSGQTTWNDISGYGYHFNLTGTTTTRPTFSGSNYGYINFNQTATEFTWAERTPTFPKLTAYTVEIWVKFNSSVANTSAVITTIYNGSINFVIGNNGNTSAANQRLIFGGRYSGGWANTDEGFLPSQQEWYQLVLTYDGSGLQKLYLNSELYSSNISAIATNISGGIRIARRWDGLTTTANMTNMSASVVRIYNRVLTQSEINNNYQSLYYRYYQNIPSIDYILDTYPNAVCAYSFRKLRSTYSGSAIRVRRESDDTLQDIGFDGNGNFDISGLTTFLGSSLGYIRTWYDQSGNGNNANQTTTSSQPTILGNNGVVFVRGRFGVFSNGDQFLSLTTNVTNARSIFMTINCEGSLPNKTLLLGSTSFFDYYSGSNDEYLSEAFAASYVKNGTNYINGVPYDLTTIVKNVTGLKPTFITMLHTSSSGRFNQISKDRNNTTSSWIGTMSEIIVYSGEQSTNRLVIENNLSTYYSIFPNS